jgi:hypothetical protein
LERGIEDENGDKKGGLLFRGFLWNTPLPPLVRLAVLVFGKRVL